MVRKHWMIGCLLALALYGLPGAALAGSPARPAAKPAAPADPGAGQQRAIPLLDHPTPRVALAVDSSLIRAGESFTLYIDTEVLGMPQVTIGVSPAGRLIFEQPARSACTWPENDQCSFMVVRVDTAGPVMLTAHASGEVHHNNAWMWDGATSAPLRLSILSGGQQISRVALPALLRAASQQQGRPAGRPAALRQRRYPVAPA